MGNWEIELKYVNIKVDIAVNMWYYSTVAGKILYQHDMKQSSALAPSAIGSDRVHIV